MKLDGRRESSNVEDRRGISGKAVAGGGIGAVIIAALFAWMSGGNPLEAGLQAAQQQMSVPTETVGEENFTEEEQALASDCKKILASTEDVWGPVFEKMGGTYSPSINVSSSRIPEAEVDWTFYINCNPDSASLIENAALEILNKYIKEGPDAETLAKVQEQQIINRQNAKQNNNFWMGQIAGSYRYNESRDYVVNDYEALVKSVTAKEIQAAAKQFIDLKHYATIFLKPEASE